jgi:hypothetical protein
VVGVLFCYVGEVFLGGEESRSGLLDIFPLFKWVCSEAA